MARPRPAGTSRVRRCWFEQLETRLPLAISSIDQLTPAGISGSTGEKPQSKVWEYNNTWFGVWAKTNGTFLHRLDGTDWTSVLQLSPTFARADIKAEGNLAHVLLQSSGSVHLASLEYVSGATPTYQAWSGRPTPTSLALPSDAECATIDVDKSGRLWLAYDNVNNIEVRYSDSPYSAFSAPIIAASNVADDDISVITAFPNGNTGVFWSNQNTRRFGFRMHVAGTSPTTWTADEVPASQSALNVGAGMADDHMNLAVGSDNTLYAAVKTSYDTAGNTALGLLVRRPNGTWDNIHEVDQVGTRPSIQLNEATGTLLYEYRLDTTEPIVYREAPISTFAWTPRATLLSEPSVNDVSSTKQNVTDDVVVVAAAITGKIYGARVRFNIPNKAPVVNAGADQSLTPGESANLNGTVTDDGLPNPPGAVTTQWSKASGPGTVSFANAAARQTTATFSEPGNYVLRLTASDSQLSAFDEIAISVADPLPLRLVSFQDGASPANTYAGTQDATIKADAAASKFGSAATLEMEGLPDAASLIRWDVSSIGVGALISSASLTFNVPNASPSTFKIYEMKRSWVESEVTWSQAAAGVSWQTAGALGANDRGTTSLGDVKFTATGVATLYLNAAGVAVVQSWINNPASNNGLIIQEYADSATNRLYLDSSEVATVANRPMLTIGYSGNNAPLVNAGSDQEILAGNPASLHGSFTDDGLPNPPGAVTTQWSKVSGPGDVSFLDAASLNTTAIFSQLGTYVLRLTANDSELSGYDEVIVTVNSVQPVLLSFQDGVSPSAAYAGTQDATIKADGINTKFGSAATLEMEGKPDAGTLIKWDLSSIPSGGLVNSASLTFNVPNASPYTFLVYEVKRPWAELDVTWKQSNASVPWETAGALGANDRGTTVLGEMKFSTTGVATLHLNTAGVSVVQSWVNNPSLNNGLVIQEYGDFATNRLYLDSSEVATAANRPKLTVGYVPNTAPSVNVGPDHDIAVGPLTLHGAVTDDGLPNPPSAMTFAWTKVSGPGPVTFDNAATLDTTATFTAPGEYVLRLTANDGQLSSFDEVTITASIPPVSVAFQNGASPSVDYAGTQDATIKSDDAGTNFGVTWMLEMDGLPDVASLIRWDVSSIPADATVSAASLTFNVPNASPQSFKIYEVKRQWVESEVTWGEAAMGVAWEIPGALGSTDRGSEVLGEVNVSAAGVATIQLTAAGLTVVQKWVTNPATNNGVIFQEYNDAAENRLHFDSSEVPTVANRPQLAITYIPSSGSPSLSGEGEAWQGGTLLEISSNSASGPESSSSALLASTSMLVGASPNSALPSARLFDLVAAQRSGPGAGLASMDVSSAKQSLSVMDNATSFDDLRLDAAWEALDSAPPLPALAPSDASRSAVQNLSTAQSGRPRAGLLASAALFDAGRPWEPGRKSRSAAYEVDAFDLVEAQLGDQIWRDLAESSVQ